MNKKMKVDYPLEWRKDDFYIKIFCSIPNIATGIILMSDTAKFIIDPGDGILRDINREFGPKKLMQVSDIFISHGHHDHIGGVWSLLTYLSVMKRNKELNIYYPEGCREIETIHKAFLTVYARDLSYDINLIAINNQKSIHINSMNIEPFEVIHSEPAEDGKTHVRVPSLGFKFNYKGKSICYGGDTAYCENLVNMVKDSDLAIIEAGAESESESRLHMTINQAEEIGKTAREYFLVHLPE